VVNPQFAATLYEALNIIGSRPGQSQSGLDKAAYREKIERLYLNMNDCLEQFPFLSDPKDFVIQHHIEAIKRAYLELKGSNQPQSMSTGEAKK
jgi:hypothetical protein